MQIRHLPRHCCPVLDNVGSIRLASLEYYTISMGSTVYQHLYHDAYHDAYDAPLVVSRFVSRYIGHDTIRVSPAEVSRCIDASLVFVTPLTTIAYII